MWRFNWIEEIEEMGIQPWSQAGSNQTAVGRPWTGIAIDPDGTPFVVYAEGVSTTDVNPKLSALAADRGGRLIASMIGWISAKGILAV